MSALARRLETLLDGLLAQGIVGASLALLTARGEEFALARGLADRFRGTPLTTDHLFKVASCTKTFTAAALLRLVEHGRLSLDEPIARWFPALPNAARILVRTLLSHRSGLPEYEHRFDELSDKRWTPAELVAFALANETPAEPGGPVRYSNTGYLLAGLIVEAEGRRPLCETMRSGFLEPLGLRETWCASAEDFPRERLARGHFHGPDGRGASVDGCQDSTGWFHFSAMGAAGDMVSGPHDLVRWLSALFEGRVLDARRFSEMACELVPAGFPGTPALATGHGLWAFAFENRTLKGHVGQLRGHVSVMAHDEASGITAALCQNSGARDVTSPHMTALHATLADVFRAAGA